MPGWSDLAARGPAARYVWDLARREDSLWVVPLGASGHPDSPHPHDQLPLWLSRPTTPPRTGSASATRSSPATSASTCSSPSPAPKARALAGRRR
ncbi:penicillin acylase family protein [Streptomyces sp. NPDC002920]